MPSIVLKKYEFIKTPKRDRRVKYGDSRKQNFTFPFDFTGGTAVFTIKKAKSSEAEIWSQDFAVGEYTIADGKSTLQLHIPGGGSFPTALIPGCYYYDWQFTFADDTVTTYLEGRLDVSDDVSD